MSLAVISPEPSRTTRLTALVSGVEAERIARLAAAAGLSVSGYLRDRALNLPGDDASSAALRQVDTLIDRMQSELDEAIAALTAALERMSGS
jgi:hypothetical protein